MARDSSEKFWKRRLLYKNEMIEIVGPLNETSRFVNDQIAKDTNFSGKLENVMEDTKERTLMDYNGPVIIGEDLDNKSDQDFADHVRVKRNEPTNDSIIRHQLNHSLNIFDSSPRNFWSNTDETNVYGGSTFDFATIVNIPYLRHKRGVLSKKNRQHGKRIKRNIRHSKHRVGTENRKKKHDTLKSSRKPAKKKANNSSIFRNDFDFILI